MIVTERFAAHAREWNVTVHEIRTTETSQLGFGTRGKQPVVLKVIRKEGGEEWRCGASLNAFGGQGVVLPLAHAPGAVLLPRLIPGHDLASVCARANDDEATRIIASLIGRMSEARDVLDGVASVDRLHADFARYRFGTEGLIPSDFVDQAETTFAELCRTQRRVRLLHGDLHHFNVLCDARDGWVAIDPWGVMGEIEFEIGPALRNPTMELVASPQVLERRLRTYEAVLRVDADRALRWAFSTTVLGILWPFEPAIGLDLRGQFASAARAMHELM
jgi:streptomycin 6-kinase